MRIRSTLIFAILTSVGFSGCNPGDFNSILDKAPVTKFGPSGSSTSSLSVLPLPIPQEAGTTVAARMLISRKDQSYLAVADYDRNGKVTLHDATTDSKANLGEVPVFSTAVRADGAILLGTPSYGGGDTPPGRVSSFSFLPQADGNMSFTFQNGLQGTSHLGLAVAAGNITGLGTGEFIAVGDDTVQLLGSDPKTPIASTPAGCANVMLSSKTEFYPFRPVAVADFMVGGFDEIALGGQSKVVIVQYDVTNQTLTCPKKVLTLGAVASFGTSLASGDFDGDNNMDLAVGTPPSAVNIYFGPLDAVTEPAVVIEAATSTGFGQRIAAYQMPGFTSAQLLVADPGANGGAGTVMLFNVTRATPYIASTSAIATLFDANDDSGAGTFGSNLGGLLFNTGICAPGLPAQLVPWVATNSNILTFFGYLNGPTDPRCFTK
jgi:hypothetical protein